MEKVHFDNGVTVNFEGNPTQADIDEVAQKLGVKPFTFGGGTSRGAGTSSVYATTPQAFKRGIKGAAKAGIGLIKSGFEALDKPKSEFDILSAPLQIAGGAAGVIASPVAGIYEAGKAAAPDWMNKPMYLPGTSPDTKVGQINEVALSKIGQEMAKYPTVSKDMQAAGNIAALEPAAGVVGKALTATRESADVLVGRITQGTAKEIAKSKSALGEIDTTGVSNYSQLNQKVSDHISNLAKSQDKLLEDPAVRKMTKIGDLGQSTTVGSKTVTQNFVKDALDQLEEFYTKTNDPQGVARIQDMVERGNKTGLSQKEINDLAREYGQKFTEKAFTKTGDPITSVNKVAAENTRVGLKETVRKMLPNDASRTLDKSMSDALTLQNTSKKLEAAVQKLSNRIKERNVAEKLARGAGKTINALTGGGAKEFVASFLPSNVGNKVMNSLDIEKELAKSLRKLNQINKSGDSKAVADYINSLVKKQAALNVVKSAKAPPTKSKQK